MPLAHTANPAALRRDSLSVLLNDLQDSHGIQRQPMLLRVGSAPHMNLRALTGFIPGTAGLPDGEHRVDNIAIRQVRGGHFVANFYTPKCLIEGMNTGNANALHCANLYSAVLLTVKDWAKTHEPELYRYIANLENQPVNTDYGVLSIHCDIDVLDKFHRALSALGGSENQRLLSLLLRYPDLFMEFHSDQSLDTLLMPGAGNPPDMSSVSGSVTPGVGDALTGVHGLDTNQPDIPPVVDMIKALADQLQTLHARQKTHGNLTPTTLKAALSRPETLAGLADAAGSGFAAYDGFDERDKCRLADSLSRDEGRDDITRKADNHMLLVGVIRLFAEQDANRTLLDELEGEKGRRFSSIDYTTPQLTQWLDRFVKPEQRSRVKDSISYPLFVSTEELSLADALNWDALRSHWTSGASEPVRPDIPERQPEPSLPPSPPHDPIPDRPGLTGATSAVQTVDRIKALADQLQTLHARQKTHGNLTLTTLKAALSRPETLAGLADAAGSGFAAYERFGEADKRRLADSLSRDEGRDDITRKADNHMLLVGVIRLFAEQDGDSALLDELDAVKRGSRLIGHATPQLKQWLETFVNKDTLARVQDSIEYPLFFSTAELSLADALNWDALRSHWTSGASEPVRPDIPERQPEPSLPPSPPHDPIPDRPGLTGAAVAKPSSPVARDGSSSLRRLTALRSVFAQLDALHREGRSHGALSDGMLARAVALSGGLDEAGIPYAQRTDLNSNCAKIVHDYLSDRSYSWNNLRVQQGQRDIDWYYALRALAALMPEEQGPSRPLVSCFMPRYSSLIEEFDEKHYVYPGLIDSRLTLEGAVNWDTLAAYLSAPALGDRVSVTEPASGTLSPAEALEREVVRFEQWQRAGGYCYEGLSAAALDSAIRENRPLGSDAGVARLQPLYYPTVTVNSLEDIRNRESYALLLSIMHWSSLQQSDWRLSHGLNYLGHELEKERESGELRIGYNLLGNRVDVEVKEAVEQWIASYIKPEQRQQVMDGLKSMGGWGGTLAPLPPLADSIDWAALGKNLATEQSRQAGAVARLTDLSLEHAPLLWRAACQDMELRNDMGHFDQDLTPVVLLERALDPSAFSLSKARENPVAPSHLSERLSKATTEQKAWINALIELFAILDPSGKPGGDSDAIDNWIESFVKRSYRADVRTLMKSYSGKPVVLADVIDWEVVEREWHERFTAPVTLPDRINEEDVRLLFPTGNRSEQALLALAFPDEVQRLIALRDTRLRQMLVKNSLEEAIRTKDVSRLKACLLLSQDKDLDVASLKVLAKELHDTGLTRFLKQQPYYGPGDRFLNLNCQVNFPVGSIHGDARTVCRHLATELAMRGKQRAKDFATAEGIQRILPNAEKAETQWSNVYHHNSHAYHFSNDRADELVRRVVDTMNREGKTQKSLVIVTDNHAVALLIHKKMKGGVIYYALEYYDPNNTAVILRKTFTDPSSLRYSLSELMGSKEDGYYFSQNKPHQSQAYDVDTAGLASSWVDQKKIYCIPCPAGANRVEWTVEQISRGTVNWDDLADERIDREELENCIRRVVANDYTDFGKHETRLVRKNRFLDTLLTMPAKYAGMLRWSRLDPDHYLAKELGERSGSSYRGGALPEFQP